MHNHIHLFIVVMYMFIKRAIYGKIIHALRNLPFRWEMM